MPLIGSQIEKDPIADLPYEIDWSRWLAGGTLLTSSWTVAGDDSALTVDTPTIVSGTGSTITQCWLHGGTPGKTYRVTNRITASGTPTPKDDRSFFVVVQER